MDIFLTVTINSFMPTWLIIILVIAAIGGVIGFLSSEDGQRGESTAQGAMMGDISSKIALS